MTKRMRLFLSFAAALILVGMPRWDGLSWQVGDAQAQRRKKKPAKPAPKPAAPAPTETPASPPPGEPQPEIEIEPEAPTGPGAPTAAPGPAAPESPPDTAAQKAADQALLEQQRGVSWQDVVVVMRKPFLKAHRLEIQPSYDVTLNDNMIRHHIAHGQVIYWLTDVLAIGAEGQLYYHDGYLEPHALVADAYRRVPTLNEYKWGAALDFHYSPIYAKFAVFNKYMVHWEGMFTAGVGVLQSKVLPRNPAHQDWTNLLIAPNLGFQARVFVRDWITLDIGVKDYIFVDKFENVNRKTADADMAKADATTQLINSIMFTAGVSFWIPTSFQYTTFR